MEMSEKLSILADAAKAEEKRRESVLDGVPAALPALVELRAQAAAVARPRR